MDIRSQFRIPQGLYEWLKGEAAREHRSINGQLAAELEARRNEKETSKASA